MEGTMPFNPSQGEGRHESLVKRALLAAPFLVILGLVLATEDFAPIARQFKLIIGSETSTAGNGTVRPMHELHWYKTINVDLTPFGITSVQVDPPVDLPSPWHAFWFTCDFAGMYAIFLIGGARRSNRLSIFSLPLLFGLAAQLWGASKVLPVYYFLLWVLNPIEKFAASDDRLTDIRYTAVTVQKSE
jgi:hypothetical protein